MHGLHEVFGVFTFFLTKSDKILDSTTPSEIFRNVNAIKSVSYTHLTLPTTPYV